MPEERLQPNISVKYWWICYRCYENPIQHSVEDIADNGTPICFECGDAMDLADSCSSCGKVLEGCDMDAERCTRCGECSQDLRMDRDNPDA